MFGLQHITCSGQHQRYRFVGHDHHGLKAAQISISAPVLGHFNASPRELIWELFQLAFQPFKQRHGISGGASKSGDHTGGAQRPHLTGITLHHGLAHTHLAIACDDNFAAFAHAKNSRAVPICGITHIWNSFVSHDLRLCDRVLNPM